MSGIYGVERFTSRREKYQPVDRDVVEEADVCIVGSGAAGAVLAKKFGDAGRSVVLLEKGGYYEGEDMNQRDEDMIPLLWKNAGAQLNDTLNVAIGQGSCLGGSTVINDAVCFPIPPITRRQWRELGVEISDEEWDRATDEVTREIRVTKVREDELNRNNLMLKRGCEAMGFTVHYSDAGVTFDQIATVGRWALRGTLAVIFNAAAASGALAGSSHKIAAQPSGEMTE